MLSDPFFLVFLAGIFLGLTSAIAVRRTGRRDRPLAFRRCRRRAVPLLLIPAVVLVGLAAFHGAYPLLLWWEWTAGLVAVPAVLVGAALGVPGRRPVLLLRGLLLLPLLVVPLSGLLFVPWENPQWIQDNRDGEATIVVVRTWLSSDAIDHERVVYATTSAPVTPGRPGARSPAAEVGEITVHRDGALLVKVDRMMRSPPLWWLPRPGTVTGVTVTGVTVTPVVAEVDEETFIHVASSPPPPALLRVPVERFLVRYRLLRWEEETLRMPDSPGRFVQPGSYTVYRQSRSSRDGLPGEAISHPPALTYRYTLQ